MKQLIFENFHRKTYTRFTLEEVFPGFAECKIRIGNGERETSRGKGEQNLTWTLPLLVPPWLSFLCFVSIICQFLIPHVSSPFPVASDPLRFSSFQFHVPYLRPSEFEFIQFFRLAGVDKHQIKHWTFNWMQSTAGNRRNLENNLKLVVITKLDC